MTFPVSFAWHTHTQWTFERKPLKVFKSSSIEKTKKRQKDVFPGSLTTSWTPFTKSLPSPTTIIFARIAHYPSLLSVSWKSLTHTHTHTHAHKRWTTRVFKQTSLFIRLLNRIIIYFFIDVYEEKEEIGNANTMVKESKWRKRKKLLNIALTSKNILISD